MINKEIIKPALRIPMPRGAVAARSVVPSFHFLLSTLRFSAFVYARGPFQNLKQSVIIFRKRHGAGGFQILLHCDKSSVAAAQAWTGSIIDHRIGNKRILAINQ
jgi:hypothetical protein